MDLDSMKYAELRSLAKELGLKANMKADKLLKMIKQHYQQEKNNKEGEQRQDKDAATVQEDENAGQDSAQENKDATCKGGVSSSAVFVNTRRGKGNGTKRKISDTATETGCDAELPPSAAQADTEVAASAAPRGGPGAKKRKVSSVKDSQEPEPPKETQATSREQHQQADIKDEAPLHEDAEKATRGAKAGKIPRYQGLQQKSKPLLKPVTPNFKKLHEAHFSKMESIDCYVQRKTKQMETYRNSVKELKNLSDKTKLQQVDGKTQATANQSRASMFSPAPVKRQADDKRRHTLLSASKAPPNKPAGKEDAPFRPSVISTRRINVRFSEATHDNEHKRSLVKTPARMSPCVTSSTPQKQTADAVKPSNFKTSTFSATKTPGPFVFTGNTSTSATPGTQKKASFDLKASLSRPLTYKPHKGKLKPFGDSKENTKAVENKSLITDSHQKNYKQHQVQTRESRRAKHMEDRKHKKESMLGARRGLVMM
ncbi:nucleolar and spindle-associated protein 1 isoform X2 [Toxotes jaculatrix]|uniref:nucleolar and spindle-associated protein 1 isoform X2 n=1 Tax=Toxotes jaculatrix TaxID=941984 RepID=UPI001B3B1A92|nr:nucleolar and spindle-associated protein 1 isoform X2 [Toxotes jaculatrix]